MAKLGSGIVDIRGQIGGVVFTKDKSCLHINATGRYIQRKSTLTVKRRTAYRTAVNFWNNSVSDTEKQLWKIYANHHLITNKVGEPKTPTAYNSFMKINIYRGYNEVPLITTQPND